jgi:hypothetical protein
MKYEFQGNVYFWPWQNHDGKRGQIHEWHDDIDNSQKIRVNVLEQLTLNEMIIVLIQKKVLKLL